MVSSTWRSRAGIRCFRLRWSRKQSFFLKRAAPETAPLSYLEDAEEGFGFGDEEAAFGEAFGGGEAELVFEPGGGLEAVESLAEGSGDAGDGRGVFVDEFEAEVADADLEPEREVGGGVLGFGAEDGVAAAGVGEDGVVAALFVGEGHFVFFAGAAAIEIGSSRGEEAAEDAMLGVEDGEVLVGDGFEAGGAGLAGEGGDLGGVEVVGGSEAIEAGVEQEGRGGGVGGVEAEVAGEVGEAALAEIFEETGGADEEGAVELGEEVGDFIFAGFEDAGAGDAGGDAAGLEFFQRGP